MPERLLQQHDEVDVCSRCRSRGHDNRIELDGPRGRQRRVGGDLAPTRLRTPPTGAITRSVTPSAAAAFTNLEMPARSEPALAMMPILRPPTRPGSARICTNTGETVTSSAGLPFGAGGFRAAATCSHRSVSTLASTCSSRSLIPCSWTLPSSRVKASTTWVCSIGPRAGTAAWPPPLGPPDPPQETSGPPPGWGWGGGAGPSVSVSAGGRPASAVPLHPGVSSRFRAAAARKH